MRSSTWRRSLAVGTVSAFAALQVFSQEPDEQDQDAEPEPVEEIVVTASKLGDPIDVEARYEQQLQEMLFKDMERMRVLQEEYEWRREEPNTLEGPSRIKWGYDPRSELEMRRQTDLMDLQWEESTKPASVIRIEF